MPNMQFHPNKTIKCHNVDEMSLKLADKIAKLSKEAIERHNKFIVGISGGSLPKVMSKHLVNKNEIEFDKWFIFLADERLVKNNDEQSNYLLIKQHLVDKVKLIKMQNVFALNDDLINQPEKAAFDYQNKLKEVFSKPNDVKYPMFDLILLGIGPDGHTCSLFPDHELLEARENIWVDYILDSPKPPSERISLTLNVLNHSRCNVFVVSDKEKNKMVDTIQHNKNSKKYPASLVSPLNGCVEWYILEDTSS